MPKHPKRIFLDSAAGSKPNPSSLYIEGVAAKKSLDHSRQIVAGALNARPDEIIFVSGGTEANNLAVLGLPAGEVVVSAIEHPSVLAPAGRRLSDGRGQTLIAPITKDGLVNLEELKKLLTPNTVLVSIIYANNEIGVVQPLTKIAKIIRNHRRQFKTAWPYFHTDACQAAPFLSLDVQRLGVDLLMINGNKLDSPRGVAALYARRGVPLRPLVLGGGQEDGRRSGTENVEAIAKFSQALVLAQNIRDKESQRLIKLRDHFIKTALKTIPETELNGAQQPRLPNNINLSFSGVLAEQVVLELDAAGVAASAGSACAIPEHDDSYVIMSLSKSKQEARESIRFTLGRETTKNDLARVLKFLEAIITKLRQHNNAYAADLAL